MFIKKSKSFLYLVFLLTFIVEPVYSFNRALVSSEIKKDAAYVSYRQSGIFVSKPGSINKEINNIFALNNIGTLNDYIDWLNKNISYKKDTGNDSWSAPRQTLSKGYGDCEDLAFLNKKALETLGYKPKALVVFRLFNNHAICIFKEGEFYTIIDNTNIKRTRAKSIKELASHLFIRYNCASVAEVHLESKDLNILYTRAQR